MNFASHEASYFELSVQIQDVFANFDDCSCALARQKQRSICFWLPFSLFLSFGQAKERKK